MPAEPAFRDRMDAALQLAGRAAHLAATRPLVLALTEGGVVVAVTLARALRAPVDIVVLDHGASTRRRMEAEARMRGRAGASVLMDVASGGMRADQRWAGAEMSDLIERLSHHDDLPPVDARAVVLADDGLSPDTDIHATLRALRLAGAATVVLATPFLTRSSADLHESELDELLALQVVEEFGAATDFYQEPGPPSTDQARALLLAWRQERRGASVT